MRCTRIDLAPVLIYALLSLSLAGCNGAANQAPQIATVVFTLPVEATRLVEVTRMVEVTRVVVVTQLVAAPTPTTTDTPAPSSTPTAMPPALTPQFTPQEKYAGYTPIVLHNQSESRLEVVFEGVDHLTAVLWQGDRQKVWLRQGHYEYTVYLNGEVGYRGRFQIVSADKYDLFLRAEKAILWSP